MKKILIVISSILLVLLISGCDNEENTNSVTTTTTTYLKSPLTCTRTITNDEGYKTTESYVITFDKYITSITFTSIMSVNSMDVDPFIAMYQDLETKYNSIPGITVNFSKDGDNGIKEVMSVDYTKLDTSKMSDILGQYYDANAFYTMKNMTITDFKKNNLTSYTCN
jgi:uncharacterized lipoprotein YehR (DUF1307 family)